MKENPIRQSSRSYRPYNRNFVSQKKPGRVVGVIAVTNPEGFNPHSLFLTVSKYRKDYKKVVSQSKHQQKFRLPEYEQLLFNSCFKNWS